jgi:hypothetical protein
MWHALSLGLNQAGLNPSRACLAPRPTWWGHQGNVGGLGQTIVVRFNSPNLLSTTRAISARGGWWLMQIHKHLIGSRGWLGVVFESATPGMLPHVKPQWRMEGCPIKTLGTIIGCPATAQGVIALKSLMATQWVAPGQHKVLSQFNSSQRCNLGWGPWEELQEWEDAPEPTPN